jgi:hypothetical protein
MSSFLSQTDHFQLGSSGKLIFVLQVFALQAVLKEWIKLVNRGITAQGTYDAIILSWTFKTIKREISFNYNSKELHQNHHAMKISKLKD